MNRMLFYEGKEMKIVEYKFSFSFDYLSFSIKIQFTIYCKHAVDRVESANFQTQFPQKRGLKQKPFILHFRNIFAHGIICYSIIPSLFTPYLIYY